MCQKYYFYSDLYLMDMLYSREEVVVVRRWMTPPSLVVTVATLELSLSLYVGRPHPPQELRQRAASAQEVCTVNITYQVIIHFSQCDVNLQVWSQNRDIKKQFTRFS